MSDYGHGYFALMTSERKKRMSRNDRDTPVREFFKQAVRAKPANFKPTETTTPPPEQKMVWIVFFEGVGGGEGDCFDSAWTKKDRAEARVRWYDEARQEAWIEEWVLDDEALETLE